MQDAEVDEHEQKADEAPEEVYLCGDLGDLVRDTEPDTACVIKDADGNKKVKGMTHQHINYIYRGKELEKMSLLEYNVTWSRCVILTRGLAIQQRLILFTMSSTTSMRRCMRFV